MRTPSLSAPCSKMSVAATFQMLPRLSFPRGTMALTVTGASSSPYLALQTIRDGRTRNRVLIPKAPHRSRVS